MNPVIQMVVSDLDGTLRRGDGTFGAADLGALGSVGNAGIVRVCATGRTLYSCRQVLPLDFPIDYLVFSSGAGIVDWRTQTMLRALHLEQGQINDVGRVLLAADVDFMVHEPIPENHRFIYRESGRENPDFRRRCEKHAQFCRPWSDFSALSMATQFLVIARPADAGPSHGFLMESLPDYHVIRATSPLDGQSAWLESFPCRFKSLACQWLIEKIGLARESVLAVGNDFNDLDLLHWAGKGYVVANAPELLRGLFPIVPSNEESGVAVAIGKHVPFVSLRGPKVRSNLPNE